MEDRLSVQRSGSFPVPLSSGAPGSICILGKVEGAQASRQSGRATGVAPQPIAVTPDRPGVLDHGADTDRRPRHRTDRRRAPSKSMTMAYGGHCAPSLGPRFR